MALRFRAPYAYATPSSLCRSYNVRFKCGRKAPPSLFVISGRLLSREETRRFINIWRAIQLRAKCVAIDICVGILECVNVVIGVRNP